MLLHQNFTHYHLQYCPALGRGRLDRQAADRNLRGGRDRWQKDEVIQIEMAVGPTHVLIAAAVRRAGRYVSIALITTTTHRVVQGGERLPRAARQVRVTGRL